MIINESFVPVSESEKQNSEIFARNLLPKEQAEAVGMKIVTSVRSPSRTDYLNKTYIPPLRARRTYSNIEEVSSCLFYPE